MTESPNQANEAPTTPEQAPQQPAPDATEPVTVSIPPQPAQMPEPQPTKLDAETEAEIEAAMSDLADMGAASAGGAAGGKIRGPREVKGGREHRSGAVVSVGATDVFVEFGPKELGVVDIQQFKDAKPNPGDQLEVVVQRYDAAESLYICVLPGSVQKADWEMLQVGQVVEARVSGTNKGGLELEVASHRAFMPASQVDLQHIPDLGVYVGEKITCTIQKIDRRGAGNIVCSRREILMKEREGAMESLKGALKIGDTIEGTVRKIMDFGAFVDLGGVDGLIHINDLTHERVNHGAKNIERFLSEGQKVSVQILKLDWDENRIGLGMKQLQADPFSAIASEVVEGAEITGKVTKIMDFGAFVEVAPGVEGLVHISELDWKRVNAVSDVLQEGEVVQVKVLKVDPEDHKISLSVKQLKERPQQSGGGRGRGNRDEAAVREETPELRRMREQAKKQSKGGPKKGGGLGDAGGMGMGLGDLKF
ncbi:MAG: 30S ribosomal protein S1 [Phycisphaerales bacterium]